jgi:hypothetical protein
MSFPEIRSLLICEDVRPEIHKKLTIVGFYGVAPWVDVRVADMSKAIDRLAFLFITGPSDEGQASVAVRVQRTDDGTKLMDFPPVDVKLRKSVKFSFTIGWGHARFPKPGQHDVILMVEGRPHFRSSFTVSQGQPGDFKEMEFAT